MSASEITRVTPEYDEPEFEAEVVNAECHSFQTILIVILMGVVLCCTGIFVFFGAAIILISPLAGFLKWFSCYKDALRGPCPHCLFLITIKKDEPGGNCPRCDGWINVDGHRFIRTIQD